MTACRTLPVGRSRIPDGYDTRIPDDWMRNDFDLYGIPGYAGTPVLGEAVNTPGAPNEAYVPPIELAPTVASTVPADGGTLAKDGDIVITFSEPVTVAEGWFDITCTVSGAHTAVVTDADPVYTLNPVADFTGGESCTVTVYASNVNDDDLIDPPIIWRQITPSPSPSPSAAAILIPRFPLFKATE